jgi:hypothetical protein
MYDAQNLQCTDTTGTTVYSPWFPRGGDYGLFTVELVAISGTSANLKLSTQLIHKNASQPGEGDPVGAAIERTASTGAGRQTAEISAGFKELVRYKFTLALSSGTGTNWAVFRVLPPAWYDKV